MASSEQPQQQQKQHTFKAPPVNAIAFATIPAADSARADAFYAAVFGWSFRGIPGGNGTVFSTGGEVMGRTRTVPAEDLAEQQQKSSGVVLYVHVDDVEAALKRATESGGAVVKEKWVQGGHTELGEFRDTEGNVVGVMKWVM